MQGITTGTFPSVSQTFIIFYVIFDVIVLATLILMILSFARTGKWLKKFATRATRKGFRRAAIRAVALDVAIAILIAIAVLYGLGSVTGYVPLTPTLLILPPPISRPGSMRSSSSLPSARS
jgi:hypothetical protein